MYGAPSTRLPEQHIALTKYIRQCREAKRQRRIAEAARLEEENDSAVMAAPSRISSTSDAKHALDITRSGIVNASNCSKTYGIGMSAVTAIWKAVANGFLLAKLDIW